MSVRRVEDVELTGIGCGETVAGLAEMAAGEPAEGVPAGYGCER